MTRYEFIAMRNGAPYKVLKVPADTTPQIRFTGNAEVKSTITLTIEPDADVNWLTDMLSVVRVDNADRVPLGLFNITTCPRSLDENGSETQELTGYDQGYSLRNLSVLERSLTIRAGTRYTTAIREQLLAAGINVVSIIDTNEVLMTDHAWETGTTRYAVVSALLAEINYRDIYFDGSGVAVAEPWAPATINTRTHRYGAAETILLRIPMSVQADTFDAANVFVDIVSSADLDAELRAVAENMHQLTPTTSTTTQNLRPVQRVEVSPTTTCPLTVRCISGVGQLDPRDGVRGMICANPDSQVSAAMQTIMELPILMAFALLSASIKELIL